MSLTRARPAFVIEPPDEKRGLASFAASVMHRISPRIAALALLVLLVAQIAVRVANLGVASIDGYPVIVPPSNWKFLLLMQAAFVACLVLGALVADEAVSRGTMRWPTYLVALVVSAALAASLSAALNAWFGWTEVLVVGSAVSGMSMRPLTFFFSALLFGGFGYSVYVNQRTARLAAQRMRQAELARAKSRRRTLESRLQAMQARVEPQFLFNTLAQVRELYERDARTAGHMLDDLIAYLRAALPHLRESSSTLGRELELARAYLDIMRMRLGTRLEFSIDVPEEAKSARLPPMMLLPLIDHALVYGLQPAESQGAIRIATVAEAGRLRLEVSDTGIAFVSNGRGSGLADISERLHALYGADARFELERMREHGTRATLDLPYETTDLCDR